MCREKEGKINVLAPGGVKGYSGKLTPITLNIPWSIFGNGNKIRQSPEYVNENETPCV
jgi:hypothetical protein